MKGKDASTINKRIEILVETFEGGTVSKLAKKIAVAPSVVSGLMPDNRSGAPNYANLIKLLEAYPDISTHWLMTGEGPMLKSESKLQINLKERVTREDYDKAVQVIKVYRQQLEEELEEVRSFKL